MKHIPSIREYGVKIEHIYGWFLQFFSYYKVEGFGGNKNLNECSLKVKDFKDLVNLKLIVTFNIIDINNNKEYPMKYKVGFVGYDQNENNEIVHIKGWIVSPSIKEERESKLSVVSKIKNSLKS